MSMSQEDIEALMNGLDMPAQDSVETIKEEPIPEEIGRASCRERV